MDIPQHWKNKKTTTMKTLRYLLLAVFLWANLTSCEPDDIVTDNEIPITETNGFTTGENEGLEEGDEN